MSRLMAKLCPHTSPPAGTIDPLGWSRKETLNLFERTRIYTDTQTDTHTQIHRLTHTRTHTHLITDFVSFRIDQLHTDLLRVDDTALLHKLHRDDGMDAWENQSISLGREKE